MVADGQVIARRAIRLTLSVDHRVLDGVEGTHLLNDLKILIEEADDMFEQF